MQNKWHNHCPLTLAMNLFDAIIIYLACGAPFGVYYFVNHRHQQNSIYFKTFLFSIFWIPFAFELFQKYVTGKLPETLFSKKEFLKEQEITYVKKNLEQILVKNNSGVSVFETRETLERYIGLTNALENHYEENDSDSEFFKVGGNENAGLASKCHHRRNRKLLIFHQTLAGQDFLKLVSECVSRNASNEETEKNSLNIARLLHDSRMEKALKLIFKDKKQSPEISNVHESEKELWINEIPQQSTANRL